MSLCTSKLASRGSRSSRSRSNVTLSQARDQAHRPHVAKPPRSAAQEKRVLLSTARRGKTSRGTPCRTKTRPSVSFTPPFPSCLLRNQRSSGRTHQRLACRSRLADVALVKLLRGLHHRRHRVFGPELIYRPGRRSPWHSMAAQPDSRQKGKRPRALKRWGATSALSLSLSLTLSLAFLLTLKLSVTLSFSLSFFSLSLSLSLSLSHFLSFSLCYSLSLTRSLLLSTALCPSCFRSKDLN